MTIRELITALEQYPDDDWVVVTDHNHIMHNLKLVIAPLGVVEIVLGEWFTGVALLPSPSES